KEKRIKFLKEIPHENIAEIVNKSHIGLSFRNEGLINEISFPVKIFEYIGAGLPVMATPYNTEGGNFLEKHNLGYQFRNEQVDEIIKKILELKRNYTTNQPYYDLTRQNQAKKLVEFIHSISKV
ncbi:MAG: hypothetical protein OXB84_07330, partial [Halobacteriovoraceae bacterium]|nr:hypothetical protein [Halobacteriovoraceae bacterium]